MQSNSLHARVRRRLFDGERFDAEEASPANSDRSTKLLDLSDVEQQNTTIEDLDVTSLADDVIDSEEKELSCLNQLLIVTTDESSQSIQLLDEYITKESQWLQMSYCQPSDALHHTHRHKYKAIYTNIDLSPDSEMLRVVCSIRKSSISNTRTPIIAICQNHSRRGADNLFYYGISFVCYGKFPVEIYHDLQQRLKLFDPEQSTVIDVTPDSNEDINILKDFDKIKEIDMGSSETTTATPFTTITTFVQPHKFSTTKTTTPIAGTYTFRPIYFPEKVMQFEQRQPHIVRPFTQRPILCPVQRPVHLLPKPKVFQQFFPAQSMDERPCTHANGVELQGEAKQNADIPHIVSGESIGNNFPITLLQDDLSKHCTKERKRRERIKYCCEQFRELLPKFQLARKIDMATVMELTVFYIKMLQKNSTPYCQQQCSQVLEFYFNQLSGKRNFSETEDAFPMNPLKMTCVDPQISNGYTPRSSTLAWAKSQNPLSYQPTCPVITTPKPNVMTTTTTTTTATSKATLLQSKAQHASDAIEKAQNLIQSSSVAQHQAVQTSTKFVQTQLNHPQQLLSTYYNASHPTTTPLPLVAQGYRYVEPPTQHHYLRPHYQQPMEYYGMSPAARNIYEGANVCQQNHVMRQQTVVGLPHTHAQKEALFQPMISNQNEQPTATHYIPAYKYQ